MEATEQSMTVAGTHQIVANPNLWSQFLGEVFKWQHHVLYRWFIASPGIFVLVVAFGLAFSPAKPTYGSIDNYTMMSIGPSVYALGTMGAFAVSGQALIYGYLPLFTIGFALVSGWCVYSEYNWRTIKMIASRQPNRVHLVLSKVLFVAALGVASFIALTLSWFALALVYKLLYGAPLALTANDSEAISLGLTHLGLRCLAMFMWALPTMAAVYSVKAVTGGVVIYLVYSAVEGFLNTIGTVAINTPQAYASADGFFQTVVDLARAVHPYLLTSHLNRITMVPTSPQVVASIPVAVSWVAMVIYALVFIGISLAIFVPRDIKE